MYLIKDKKNNRECKVYNLGERGSGIRPQGPIQDYKSIKNELLDTKKLWVDSNFPPEFSSIARGIRVKMEKARGTYFRRATEVLKNPVFFEGLDKHDINQGSIGNCWVLAAMADLTVHRNLFNIVVPENQSFSEDYCGIFHFRIWHFGSWIDVCVDDYLPVQDKNGKTKLAYIKSDQPNELWPALLEKAYAKLSGTYENMHGGIAMDSMIDFTGGVSELIELWDKTPPNMFRMMEKAHERSSLMSSLIPGSPELALSNGLYEGHAYGITDVKKLSTGEELVRLINPWGRDLEWNGAWSDKSQELKSHPELDKGVPGEFWMSFDDFKTSFQNIQIVHLDPSTLTGINSTLEWQVSQYHGEWIKGISAGGNWVDNPKTFLKNPQYRITIDDTDDDGYCQLFVSLMQKEIRVNGLVTGAIGIGFIIFQINPSQTSTPLENPLSFKDPNIVMKGKTDFFWQRGISKRMSLPPGTYVIVPCTNESDWKRGKLLTQEGYARREFFLRVFSEAPHKLNEHEKHFNSLSIDLAPLKIIDTDTSAVKVDERSEKYFNAIAGSDSTVSWRELKSLLDKKFNTSNPNERFTEGSCRSLVAFGDFNKSGALGLEEFRILWNEITKWTHAFYLYDKDGSGNLDDGELSNALGSAGFQATKKILGTIQKRYGDGSKGTISLNNFITVACKLKAIQSSADLDDEFNEQHYLMSINA